MAILKIVFTLDYEIHGNGEGSPQSLMVEPTQRLLDLFDSYGAKLTILADVPEILKFKEYFDAHGRDDYHYMKIIKQLRYALINGHDVQLHVHSSYFNSKHGNGKWHQDWSEYSLSGLPYERSYEMIRTCKEFLEEQLIPVKPDYKCFVFRAANWSMNPSLDIVKALVDNNIKIDTSVFKYGIRNGRVSFDYTSAVSDTIPWPVAADNVCCHDPNGKLFEFPIYCESRNILSFLSLNRVFRVLQGTMHRHEKYKMAGSRSSRTKHVRVERSLSKIKSFFTGSHAWKLDFNQCSGRQLIRGIKRIEDRYRNIKHDVPVVLIGHSKLFTKINERNLKLFLKYIVANHSEYSFSTFGEFDLTTFMAEE